MNSSALSDDGKFSTRALRGFGPTSDLDYQYNVEQPHRGQTDVMGLSTQVEISERGSRRNARQANDEEMIREEIEDDESGRTGLAGTIGEAHDCVSENIESNVIHRLKKGAGN
jgi:hypothetical protein